jgi:phenylpyruvate tautomerase PptA (4-oxalocrotonate tautomerase family)
MPLYRCTVSEGLTSEDQRARIAKEIVRIHCDVTGAPASFVHAFFAEASAESLPDGMLIFVVGSIRKGRSDDDKEQIVSELTDAIARATGCDQSEVGVVTADVPAKWNMEGGVLLPEPGEEAEWLAKHH